ncbi:hypothetical protein BDV23DRAFT_176997 [Aspergillus alliaceus]|uniref:Amino acid permease-domain-containing protein n=1 Tax=Petromyces alliaceus TaxID=209559 RepID=A0A5N7BRS9_PETAA|nr:hypothetical protein BDV23DRAFT_176997 [Aspergillus alliaceus]
MAIIGIQLAGYYTFQAMFRHVTYSIKLKLEYFVLNQLIQIAKEPISFSDSVTPSVRGNTTAAPQVGAPAPALTGALIASRPSKGDYGGSRAIFTCARVALSLGSAGVGMWQLGLILVTVAATAGTHADDKCEVHKLERSIPIAILCTVLLGFVTSWFFLEPPTGVPILALFYQALQNKTGAIVLESLILVTRIGCQIACQTWHSRSCGSLARDHGLPTSVFLAKVHPTLDVPLDAHSVSMVTTCIVLLYMSYLVPIVCLCKGREIIPHGPFWLRKLGLVRNWIVLAWTLFCLVIYSFPAVYPVNAGSRLFTSLTAL